MSKALSKLKHEIKEAIPPATFFFVAFQLIAFTDSLMLKQYGISVSTFVTATVGALIVAKVVLIADMMPFMNRFPEKPLIYNIAWKTAIYMIGAILVRFIEHLIDFIREYGNLSDAIGNMLDKVVWPHFWAVQIWLAVLFSMYCALRELTRVLGGDRIRRLFFTSPAFHMDRDG